MTLSLDPHHHHPSGTNRRDWSVVLDDNTIYEGPEDYKLTVQEGKDTDDDVIAKMNPAKESVTTTIYDDGTTDIKNPVDPNDPSVGDDRPQISIDGPVTINEDAGTVEYTVSLDKASDDDTKVTVTFENIDTDTDDIVSKTLTTTIPWDKPEGTVSVVLDDNTIYEGQEDYKLTVQEGKDADGNVIATVNPPRVSPPPSTTMAPPMANSS